MSMKEGARMRGHVPQEGGPVLSVKDLGVEFWVGGGWAAAAKHVTYDLMPGKVLAIVGESGRASRPGRGARSRGPSPACGSCPGGA